MPLLLFLFPVSIALLLLWRNAAAARAPGSFAGELPGLPPSFLGGGDFDEFGNAIYRGSVELVPPTNVLWFIEAAGDPQVAAPAIAERSFVAPATSWLAPSAATSFLEPIARAEARYGIPPNLLARLLQEESSFNPIAVGPLTRSGERARGIAQFMPGTAREFGVDPLDPLASIDAAGKYLRQLFDSSGDWRLALAAYNWGPGNLTRQGAGKAPAATRKYVDRITADVPV